MIQSRKGFTLIEIVITMLIVVIVFGIVANLVGFSTKFFRDENTQVANQEALRLVAVSFEKDFRKYALNSTLITSGSAGCYTLGTAVTYCLNANEEITRNGNIIAKDVASFSLILTNTSYIHFEIESIQDSRGIANNLEMDIYYRTERS